MKKNILAFGMIALLSIALGIFWGHKNTTPNTPQTSAVTNLLGMTLVTPQGQEQQLTQWKNKALIVNFWATWCAPCVEEMPELSALQSEIQSQDIHIIGIGIDSAENIKTFASKHKINYPLYVGGIQVTQLSKQFGNQAGGLPFTVLINKQGDVKKTYLGRLKMEELRKDLGLL